MAAHREVISPRKTSDAGKVFNLPLSPAIRAGGFIFVAGSVALNPDTGEPEHGTVASETRRILQNIKALLESAGSSLDKVVKVNVFIHDMNEFENMNRVYREFFPKEPPARTTCGVQLGYGFKVEIECTALA
jgi:2-iminobutanoate/2-iminopropanoate deaminase